MSQIIYYYYYDIIIIINNLDTLIYIRMVAGILCVCGYLCYVQYLTWLLTKSITINRSLFAFCSGVLIDINCMKYTFCASTMVHGTVKYLIVGLKHATCTSLYNILAHSTLILLLCRFIDK